MTADLPPMELGYAGTELRRELVEAVLRGDKTATAGLHGEDVLAKAGERWLLLDFDDKPVAVVETTEVRVVRAGDVDLDFARDEGEGFEQSRTGARRTSASGTTARSRTTRSSSPNDSGWSSG